MSMTFSVKEVAASIAATGVEKFDVIHAIKPDGTHVFCLLEWQKFIEDDSYDAVAVLELSNNTWVKTPEKIEIDLDNTNGSFGFNLKAVVIHDSCYI